MDEEHSTKTDRRRRRPALSCVSCRRSKIRCDRNLPCGACVRSKHRTCVYEPQGPLRQSDISSIAVGPLQPADGVSSIDAETTVSPGASGQPQVHRAGIDGSHEDHSTHSLTGSTPVDSTSSQIHGPSFDVRSLLDRIRELERRLEEHTERHPVPRSNPRISNTATEPIVATYPSYLAGDLHTMNKSVMSKTRYLGQSHWMNQIGNFKSVLEVFDRHIRDKKSEPIVVLINKAKALARTIKAQRTPELSPKFGTNLPPREIADKLVDGYLRTLESVIRVLHVPSFRKEYENFWLSPDSADLSFVILLQLVMAIGSAVHDETFSMRNSAIQWVYEAQCWLISPVPKTRLTLSGLQVMILLCLAQQTASVGHDLVWIQVGTLMRTAIFMGLHRDPKKLPKMNRFRVEMRRRLWDTILELALQTSVDSGSPPQISSEDYDTCAPSNYDDEQLTDGDDGPAIFNPPEKFTDMSMALALRSTFSTRLAIVRSLNDLGAQNTYDETIRLHSQLSAAYKSLSKCLQRFGLTDRQPTGFQRRFVDLLVRRYFMALHLPYFGPAMTEPAYAFSRKNVVEMAAKIWSTVFPSAALSPRPRRPPSDGTGPMYSNGDDLARFTLSSGGLFRSILSQASMVVGLELQHQLQEDDSLGPPTPRMDLFNILRDSTSWIFHRILIGETNLKGYMFGAGLLAQAEALVSGLKGAELEEAIVKAGSEAVRECFDILKQRLEPKVDDATTTSDSQFNFDTMMAMDEDWEYDSSMQNVLFDFTSIESVLGVAPDTGGMMAPPDFSRW
ncbi:hypothetical protein F5Y05DRAFT_406335 [Hypoxylon sp. FL0543]|nr:hypothetical protein F5Y05DRAFT_406335 [Hypoxylon sp. FL0543]